MQRTDVLMAVPKKKVSYTRKRKRIAGFQAVRGPKLQSHLYMCPVCERMRAPHRVCDRHDCSTCVATIESVRQHSSDDDRCRSIRPLRGRYFRHKWF